MTKQVTKLAVAVLGATLLSACAGIREHRGFVLDEQYSHCRSLQDERDPAAQRTRWTLRLLRRSCLAGVHRLAHGR